MDFGSVYVSVLNAFKIVEWSDKNIAKNKKNLPNMKAVFVQAENNVLYRDDFMKFADTTNTCIVCCKALNRKHQNHNSFLFADYLFRYR